MSFQPGPRLGESAALYCSLMAGHDFRTLNELFLKAIEKHSKPDAFLYKSGGRYQPFASLEALRKVSALARALDRLGVRAGDRVAILSENRIEWALTDYALLGLGAVVVPIYPALLEPDVEYILRDSGSKGVVVSSREQFQKVASVRRDLPELKCVLPMEGSAGGGTGARVWEEAVEAELAAGDPVEFFRARALETRPETTASVLYTSGTTGQYKGVVLTHANLCSNILASQGLFTLGRHDVGMSFLPLSHVFERMLDYQYLWLGVSIAYAESFDSLPQNLLEVRPTVMAVVPRVLEKIHSNVMAVVGASSPAKQRLFQWAVDVGHRILPYRLEGRRPPLGLRVKRVLADALVYSQIRTRLGGRLGALISGAAPLSSELVKFFYAVGLPVYEGYGLTETSPVISVNHPGALKLSTVGRPLPGVEVRLDTAADGEDGAGGEIMVRGPNVSAGYYHLEEENRRAFEDGWFRTGDLGRLDAEGFLTITGRKKNLMKTSGGKYVSPEKLENLFQGHPYIAQVVVLGDGRKFPCALFAPDFARLEAYARGQGIDWKSREELVTNPQVRDFIARQVDGLTRWLAPHEKIREFALLPREFSLDYGELSVTQKVKRRVVEGHFKDVIEEMYRRHVHHSRPA